MDRDEPAPRRRRHTVGKTVGGAIGGKLGGPLGRVIGSGLGKAASSVFGKIFGRGAYTVKTNTITNPGSYVIDGVDQVPLMHNDMGTTRIRHREYITDIFSTEDFTNLTFAIQPTNSQLFPWLAAAAQNYEQHKWLGVMFEFKSLSANALTSANTGLGSVSLATQYNALNAPFVNKQELLNYQFASSCKPADSMLHPVECDPGQTPNQPLYVRIGSQAAGDARLYDIGVLNLVTQGMQSDGATIGELWVTYDILLIKPRISSGLGLALRSAFYTYRGIGGGGWVINDDSPMGTEAISSFDSIGLEFEFEEVAGPGIDCTITFPLGCEGLYLVQNTDFGNGTASVGNQTIGTVVYTNCTARSGLYNVTSANTTGSIDVGLNGGVADCIAMSNDNIISIPNPNLRASIKYVSQTGWIMPPSVTGISVGNLVVCQLNNQVAPPAAANTPGHFGLRKRIHEEEKIEREPAPGGRRIVVQDDDDTYEGVGPVPVHVVREDLDEKRVRRIAAPTRVSKS